MSLIFILVDVRKQKSGGFDCFYMQTILLAEDNEDDVFFFRRALARIGTQNPLLVVSDGEQALDYFFGRGEFSDRTRYPLPSLIILDISMPKYSGLEVCEKIKHDVKLRNLPLIILSTSDDPRDTQLAGKLQVNQYIMKPTESGVLAMELKLAFERWLPKEDLAEVVNNR